MVEGPNNCYTIVLPWKFTWLAQHRKKQNSSNSGSPHMFALDGETIRDKNYLSFGALKE